MCRAVIRANKPKESDRALCCQPRELAKVMCDIIYESVKRITVLTLESKLPNKVSNRSNYLMGDHKLLDLIPFRSRHRWGS